MDLYALPPEEFTAARDAAAKTDKTLKALRKPTVSAWLVNTLVRRDSRLLDELLALGSSLAEAQRQGRGDALRELGQQRRQLVSAVARRALDLGEREVSATVRGELEATLEAAVADPASAEAVRTGRLVRPLSFAGFGGVDLEGAVASLPRPRTSPKTTPRKAAAGRPDPSAAEAAALEAAGALDDAVRRAEAAARAVEEQERSLAAAQAEEHAAAERVQEAQEAVKAAQQDHVQARRRRTAVEKDADPLVRRAKAAAKAVAAAQGAADAAREALDRARRGR
ncbi:MAG: transposase [Frankiales bacterium]|nr:transposase [Frankiales bacterium]